MMQRFAPRAVLVFLLAFALAAAPLSAADAPATPVAAPAAVATASPPAATPPPPPPAAPVPLPPHGIWLLTDENDTPFGSDRDLTNILRLAYTSPNYPDWKNIPFIPDSFGAALNKASFIYEADAVVAGGIYAQQNMWTPSNLSLSPPDPNDRPYAGWVGLGLDLIRQTAHWRAVFELNLGWVGPESGAQQLQTAWHNIYGGTDPKGWYYQIKNEPIIQLTRRQDWRPAALTNIFDTAAEPLQYDAIGHALITVGNGWDYIALGFVLRAGHNLPADYGPTRPRLGEISSMPYKEGGSTPGGWAFTRDSFSVYACLGLEGRAIARDITLDGNTFANSPSVVNEPLVAEAYGGVVLEYGALRLSALAVFETKTFRDQYAPQWRGILSVGCGF